ncbi:hypothetical protein Clacol_002353 [Clathrus columnatus]|uniref:Glycosyl hydrolase family 30 TIM-barrel domain-containing protein n=1 Tax=Clathrus columnatus TaxID=1419009 RepID=A0AAV5A1K9_9AGAM|nr:hypothetical protein Clacol_002353 [Clathrus columnatus]
MDGFGASLITKFWKLLESSERTIQYFPGAGLTTLRLPIGASDFSANAYSWDDTWDDTTLSTFSANVAPNYVWSTLQDIMSISPIVKIFALPWSPPAWMKSTSTMLGGNLDSGDVSIWANYLLKSVQALESKGFTPYAIGIQNEPQNSNPTYPTALVNVSLEAQVGLQLRTLLNNNGFSNVKIVGYEHNWDDATAYPVQLMQAASSAFDGVAFHCYAGSVSGQSSFHNAYPSKDIFHTECTGTLGTDWWSNIKWYMDNLFVGSPENWGRTAMMWNLALDPNGNPILPGSSSCGGGCRGVVTISNGQYSVNEEYYVMAQTSRALIPKDAGGPFGQRIGVTVNGNLNWALLVGAYQTGRANPSDPDKWSIVVLNWQGKHTIKYELMVPYRSPLHKIITMVHGILSLLQLQSNLEANKLV